MRITEEITYGVLTPSDVADKTGKEILQAVIDGKLPQPMIAKTMTFWITEIGDGFAVFEGEPGPHLFHPMGVVRGGWVLTMIDSAAGCAGWSLLAAAQAFTTIETKVNMSRPIFKDTGRVRVEGRVINQGRQIISAEAKVLSRDGKVLAHGTSTLMVISTAR